MDIEWIEIPAGEAIVGLSLEQKRLLVQRLHWQLGGLRQLFTYHRKRLKAAEWWISQIPDERRIRLSKFYVSRYPVTLQQYVEYQRQVGHPTSPVSQRTLENGWGKLPALVDYENAVSFCRHIGVRLPTSIEWEKAARGPENWLYPWGNKWDPRRANVIQSIAKELPKDRKPRNSWASEVDAYPTGQSAYGVWDLVGNIQEWTSSTRNFALPKGGNWQAHVVRRYPIRLCDDLAWIYNLLAMELPNEDGRAHAEWYIGFRVVRD
jgi:formylglycine-generating enzyme required for sulfatase activity